MIMTIEEYKNMYKSLPTDYARKSVVSRTRVIVTSEPVTRCENCQQMPLMAWRGDRRYCSKACKQKAYRQRKAKRS